MKTDKGWIKLHRQIADDEMWSSEPFDKSHAWIDLLLSANHKMGFFFVRGNKIDIDRGQLGWSELTMAKRWTWSRNKVRRFLNLLEKEQQIAQKKSSITTVLTILNYDKYQTNDTADDTAERQQKDSRRYTNKNDKNEKKYIDASSISIFTIHEIAMDNKVSDASVSITLKLMDHWCKTHKSYKNWKRALEDWVLRGIQKGDIKTIKTDQETYDEALKRENPDLPDILGRIK